MASLYVSVCLIYDWLSNILEQLARQIRSHKICVSGDVVALRLKMMIEIRTQPFL